MVLTFASEKCTGCRLCTLACSGSRIGVFSERLANLAIISRYRGNELEVGARICDRCGDCVEACPADALALSGGLVSLDGEKCTSCGACVDACPKGVIYLWKDAPVFCNFCKGDPWCAKICPMEALALEEVTP
jgi:Fe-S-cluster-containing hydrogenase component 2